MYIKNYISALRSKNFQEMLNEYSKEVAQASRKPLFFVRIDMIASMIIYGALYSEYSVLQFYKRSRKNRKTFFTTFFEFKLNDVLNDPHHREVFLDKAMFLTVFKDYIQREWCTVGDDSAFRRLFSSHDSLVIKEQRGCSGSMVRIIDTKDYVDAHHLQSYMRKHGYNLVETVLVNHPVIADFNPNSLNTIRFVTITNNKAVRNIAAVLRVGGKNSKIDNISQGGACAPINIDSGKISGPFLTKLPGSKPVCEDAVGVRIPFWEEIKELVSKAAVIVPEIRFVAWDIAVTPDGPLIVEGNHSFGTGIMQMHIGITEPGLKPFLMEVVRELGIDFHA